MAKTPKINRVIPETEHQRICDLLVQRIVDNNNMLSKLVTFYDATQNALEREKFGHNDGWTEVQKITDEIEDGFDFTIIREMKIL